MHAVGACGDDRHLGIWLHEQHVVGGELAKVIAPSANSPATSKPLVLEAANIKGNFRLKPYRLLEREEAITSAED